MRAAIHPSKLARSLLPTAFACCLATSSPTHALPALTPTNPVPAVDPLASSLQVSGGTTDRMWALESYAPFSGLVRLIQPQSSGFGLNFWPQSIAALSDSTCAILEHIPVSGDCDIAIRHFTSDGDLLYSRAYAPTEGRGCAIELARGPDSTLFVLTTAGYIEAYSLHAPTPSWYFYVGFTTPSEGVYPRSLATDAAGNIAVTVGISDGQGAPTYYLRSFVGNSGHASIFTIPIPEPSALAVDASGTCYVAFSGDGSLNRDVVRAYAPDGAEVLTHVVANPHSGTIHSLGVSLAPFLYVAHNCSVPLQTAVLRGDYDHDWIPDTWETYGARPFLGSTLLPMTTVNGPVSVSHKDLLVEVDALSGFMPSSSVLNDVRDYLQTLPSEAFAFPNPDAQDGVTLHLVRSHTNIDSPSGWPPGFWARNFFPIKQQYFSPATSHSDSAVWRRIKEQVYRYCVFADTMYHWVDTPLGQRAEPIPGFATTLRGKDFAIGLGASRHNNMPMPGGTPEAQARTFLHELGHTLGLRHGGDSDYPYKPNYRSVMSYLWGGPHTSDWNIRNGPDEYQAAEAPSLDLTNLAELSGVRSAIGWA